MQLRCPYVVRSSWWVCWKWGGCAREKWALSVGGLWVWNSVNVSGHMTSRPAKSRKLLMSRLTLNQPSSWHTGRELDHVQTIQATTPQECCKIDPNWLDWIRWGVAGSPHEEKATNPCYLGQFPADEIYCYNSYQRSEEAIDALEESYYENPSSFPSICGSWWILFGLMVRTLS